MTQAQKFLDEAYEQLDFLRGDLIASDLPASDPKRVEKGDWADLAARVGADSVFFVQENPVVVFAKRDSDDPEVLRDLVRSAWCMARPNLLFLAHPGALDVYDLTKAPARDLQEWDKVEPLDTVREVSKVAEALKAYHRGQIETGKLFEEVRFGTTKRRADKSLIQDLRSVRASLMGAGLAEESLKYAHALIGRSIFIRYLEDRGVLKPEYFRQLAEKNKAWLSVLASESTIPYASSQLEESSYVKVLRNHEFTYALFHELAKDFNGDMFPEDEAEEQAVTQEHLLLLQRFLRSDTEDQRKLFFWAYRFDIIPIELVSSIYEEFYTTTANGTDSKGTHYTPPALVEFLLSQVLTQERLREDPVVLDPACGSGIFLVEAFRRIVRHRVGRQNGRRLSPQQLRNILRDQIRGIDLNEEAIRVAAFSLYLALLHYQEPKDILEQIRKGYRLPCLVKPRVDPPRNKGGVYFDILQANNAFSPDVDMKVNVVVGNPPWGHPATKDNDERVQAKVALDWCKRRECPVGDEERSQAFIWRSIDFLRSDGRVGLLVSSGILHKIGKKPNYRSRAFRKKWIDENALLHVAHFARVRDVFFANAIAPFAAVVFKNTRAEAEDRFQYFSPKMSEFVQSCQAVVLSKNDIHWLNQRDFLQNDTHWKTYWLGGHRDAGLLGNLKAYPAFEELKSPNGNSRAVTGGGYKKRGGKLKPADWLHKYKSLPAKLFTRSIPVEDSQLVEVPAQVFCWPPEEDVLWGPRILVAHGIKQSEEPKGQLYARFETKDYCFEKSIYGIKLRDASIREYHVLLGILRSSLARYYLFLTCSQWGTWNFQILLDELRRLPIRLPDDKGLQQAISRVVKAMDTCYGAAMRDSEREAALQWDLDEAVFDAYEMCTWERDQVRDMCDVGISYFYDSVTSPGARSIELGLLPERVGTAGVLLPSEQNRTDIRGYLKTFLDTWNRELESGAEFSWRVVAPGNPAPMVAVVFSTQAKGADPYQDSNSDELVWQDMLTQLASDLRTPLQSDRIYVDGLVRVVSATQIIIVKRNMGRLWTRSAAREDAEATLLKAMYIHDAGGGRE